jgi:hypothetical protein
MGTPGWRCARSATPPLSSVCRQPEVHHAGLSVMRYAVRRSTFDPSRPSVPRPHHRRGTAIAPARYAPAPFACRGPERPPRRRAGRNCSACRNANNAENVMPTRRNGRASSQITGHSTKANNASGQHRTKSRHQATTAISVFIRSLRAGRAARNGPAHVAILGDPRQSACDEPARATDQAVNTATKRVETRLWSGAHGDHKQGGPWPTTLPRPAQRPPKRSLPTSGIAAPPARPSRVSRRRHFPWTLRGTRRHGAD